MTYDHHEYPIDQEYVDRYIEKTEKLALDVDSEEKAIAVLKRINYLHYISDEYFVPDIIEDWKETAMDYMESPEAYFRKVLYDILRKNHQQFFKSVAALEESVLKGHLAEEELFVMVMSFNNNIEDTNESCERHGMEKFPKYLFKSDLLQEDYEKWLM